MVKNTRTFLVILSILFFNSCASLYTSKSHYDDIDYFLQFGDNKSALESLHSVKNKNYSEKDRVLYYLEEGMLYRYAGEYSKSNESLTKAENAIEELLVDSISKGILSVVLNDNALEYSGEDYEDIYINLFKSLNYLQLNKNEEALIEIRRVNDKLNNLENKYTKELTNLNNSENSEIPKAEFSFYNDAMARYLGILAYRMEGSYDDARIEREYLDQAYNFQQKIYNFAKPVFPDINSNKTYINVFAYTGFSPEKVSQTLNINTGLGSIYIDSRSKGENQTYIGFNTIGYRGLKSNLNLKLQFPMLVSIYDPVSYIELFIDGNYSGTLNIIESIDNVAFETFKVKQPLIVGKTVVRAVSKAVISKITENKVTEEFGQGFGLLTNLAGAVYMQVSENSDLRISRYFPSMIRGLELEIEPGIHDFSFVYYNSNFTRIYEESFMNKEIKLGALNLLESHLLRKQ